MSILELSRDGCQVKVSVTIMADILRAFPCSFRTVEPWAAWALVARMQDQLDARMRTIRADAYARGWKDAKAKRARETWFSGELP